MSIPYKALEDPEYRHQYVNSLADGTLAVQLRLLREKNGLTQKQLADKAGMQQSRISALEDINYSSWSVRTLRRLAKVFDVAVVVRFERFGKTLHELEGMTPGTLAPLAFELDPVRDEPNQTASTQINATSALGLSLASLYAASRPVIYTPSPRAVRAIVSRPHSAHMSVAPPTTATTAGH